MPVKRDEIEQVLREYRVGECQAYQRVESGYVNDTWLIQTTTGRYLLKQRHPDLLNHELIVAQHALIGYLFSLGFPAPQLVPTRSQETYLCLAESVYELQVYIAGALCNRNQPTQAIAAARALGQYHRLVRGFDHPAFHRAHPCYDYRRVDAVLKQLRQTGDIPLTGTSHEILTRLEIHARQLAASLDRLDRLPHLVVHGDYYAENIIFQGKKVAGIVDYDQANWCARVQEVAEAMIYFAQERNARFRHIVYSGTLDLDAARSFLTAYVETVHLSDAEVRALPHLIRLIWVCAALSPPLRPRLRLDKDRKALCEVLDLADWAQLHAKEIADIGFEVLDGKHRKDGSMKSGSFV